MGEEVKQALTQFLELIHSFSWLKSGLWDRVEVVIWHEITVPAFSAQLALNDKTPRTRAGERENRSLRTAPVTRCLARKLEGSKNDPCNYPGNSRCKCYVACRRASNVRNSRTYKKWTLR
jgi:hypothetical protein